MSTVTERVQALKVVNPTKIREIHICSDSNWDSFEGPWEICRKWSATQLDEWVFMVVLKMGEDSTALDDDGNSITGFGYNLTVHQTPNLFVMEGFTDRDDLQITIFVKE